MRSCWCPVQGVVKVMDGSGTWVFQRTDPGFEGFRVWYDDEISLGSKYAMVQRAGWGGIGMWLANGMFPGGLHIHKPRVFDCYCPDALRRMWSSIQANFVAIHSGGL
jgi:hypothetical protein